MIPIEIRIDPSTLPEDGQKIKWQTRVDFNRDIWKEGVFSSGDDHFVVDSKQWNLVSEVLHWYPVTNKL